MTDARVMNRMSEDAQYGHLWLTRYYNWSSGGMLKPFPRTTILGRVMEMGHMGGVSGPPPPIEIPPGMDQMGILVRELPLVAKTACDEYYKAWLPMSQVALKLGWSDDRLTRALGKARRIVAVGMAKCGFPIR